MVALHNIIVVIRKNANFFIVRQIRHLKSLFFLKNWDNKFKNVFMRFKYLLKNNRQHHKIKMRIIIIIHSSL